MSVVQAAALSLEFPAASREKVANVLLGSSCGFPGPHGSNGAGASTPVAEGIARTAVQVIFLQTLTPCFGTSEFPPNDLMQRMVYGHIVSILLDCSHLVKTKTGLMGICLNIPKAKYLSKTTIL